MTDILPSPDTFNARWITPESVAETFVPIPQFRQLIHNSHSLLLGPRGCGKTTLLKMLTRPAQEKWRSTGRADRFDVKFNPPGFEAVYIPSDVRWSFEVRAIPTAFASRPELVLGAQRVMVGINAIYHLLGVVRDLVEGDRLSERLVSEQLVRRLGLKDTIATIRDVRCSLEEVTAAARGAITLGDSSALESQISQMPTFMLGHALDPVMTVIRFVSEHLSAASKPNQWALCYDELEIAPEWLRRELIEGLRSGPQDVLLKLTWHPILPSGIPTSPSATDDFRPIRLWHSHVGDPRQFCEELTREFLERKFGDRAPTPMEFFSRSVLAAEPEDEPPKAYERGSTECSAFRELASWDKSFEALLKERGIDTTDPVPKSQQEKDEFFRKVKPIVLLRNEFGGESRRRSRKAPALYVGREAVYAISEGNPRWLLSLLNDLVDLGFPQRKGDRSILSVSYASQGRILTNASIRLRSLIKSSPFKPPASIVRSADHTLLGFVELLGRYFQESLYDRRRFSEDPISSFEFPAAGDGLYALMVTQLLEIGALVYVGSSQQDVPSSVNGSRFRLSFMLAPIFKLPFRNFKAVSLREILLRKSDEGQIKLPIEA